MAVTQEALAELTESRLAERLVSMMAHDRSLRSDGAGGGGMQQSIADLLRGKEDLISSMAAAACGAVGACYEPHHTGSEMHRTW